MPELEFLPGWYRRLRRNRRLLAIQAAAALIILIALGVWALILARRVTVRQADLRALQTRMAQTQDQVRQLHDLQELRTQMLQQAQAVRKLGTYVPTSRLIDALSDLVPPEMALLDLNVDTQSQARVEPVMHAPEAAAPVDRKLRVSIHGVARSDDDIGKFLTRLSTIPYFSGIAMTYSRDHAEFGHVMREFEINFSVRLNDGDH